MTENLQRSPLHEDHLALGARLVPFAGWEMPVQYAGLMAEHHAVRQNVGVFDISHMGQLIVSGPGAEAFLNHALTNDISRLAPGHGHYTILLNDHGGVIDDLIAYRTDPNTFLLVINAARITEDWTQLTALHAQQPNTEPLVELANLSPACAGLAIQGPKSRAVFATLFGPDATYPEKNTVISSTTPEGLMWLCGTGYTGEDGFEFFMPATTASDWFQRIVTAVQNEGGLPCGLGARDTLRLEMGYPLNGNDLSPDHTPLQAGLGFFVALNKKAFIGQPALLHEKTAGLTRKLTGFRMTGTAPPPRPHYPVFSAEGQPLGEICSGTLSPTLQYGIGMAYLPPTHTNPGTPLQIEIRGKTYPAEVTKKPFYLHQKPAKG
jgi:aminomethyltransferase